VYSVTIDVTQHQPKGVFIMNMTQKTITVRELFERTVTKKLHPNPIGQRPPVTRGYKKASGIIRSLLCGMGVGMLTLRDITTNPSAKAIYPGYGDLAIDGGHRIRAIVDFMHGVFGVDGVFYNSMDDDSRQKLLSFVIPVASVICTSREATDLFRAINTTTPVNFMEMIMSDDESDVTKEIRIRTKSYVEYGNNQPSPLFGVTSTPVKDNVSDCFDMEPNHRRKWDEYVAIAMIRAANGSCVNAGEPAIEQLVENNVLPDMKVVDRFLKDAYWFRDNRGKKFNTDSFAAFMLVWFGFYNLNRTFVISNMNWFMMEFMRIYSLLTGRGKDLENETITYNKEKHFLKEFFRKNMKNFADGDKQSRCFDEFQKLISDRTYKDMGITMRTESRSIGTAERESRLALQGYKCAIDGEPLELKDSVYGHDTCWAKGGDLDSGAVIRASHNRDMGTTTLAEYRMILKLRTEAVNA